METLDIIRALNWLTPAQDFPLSISGFELNFQGLNFDPPDDFVNCHQVHGIDILEVDSPGSIPRQGDGLLTRKAGITLAVKTADCVPILVAHPSGLAMAVHAGWRGLAGDITARILAGLASHQLDPKKAHCWIGPSIGPQVYEVGPELPAAFLRPELRFTEQDRCFFLSKGASDRWFLDLQSAAALSLSRLGFPAHLIHVVRSCTFSRPDLWHSFRRSGSARPSNWSWIRICQS